MKPIELTTEQKEKLLEMCKNLFPEMDAFMINDNGMILGTWGQSTDGISIHWFEFSMTWLSHKIIFNPQNPLIACNHNHAGLLESTMSIFYGENYGIHPVDYLYEKLKKLK